ncbi:ubiquinol-cytochrome-c reductase complex assembly factor 2 isoform X2 [Aythya fuligula]|uniref:Mitochondrial nucleoid factor 1 n=1 Tax=Aythya fuligula TaxID=219594 RepID=A0A6J3EB89_AYTFU|nr:ubiquinol-cytochrome-c reductase complex assembly factor 2 isoform X2 [Aythya fuligula]
MCCEAKLVRDGGERKFAAFWSSIIGVAGILHCSEKIADPETCDQMYESLLRIHTNYYKNKYPRLKETSFTGVTVQDCKMILATDILKQMEDMKKGTWKKLRERFSAKKSEEDLK